MTKTTNGNLLDEDFGETIRQPITEEQRILLHEAICKKIGEELDAESYVEICQQYCIEAPFMPPACCWEP